MSLTTATPFRSLLVGLVATVTTFAQSPAAATRATAPAPAAKQVVEPALEWHDVTKWGVEGRAFGDMERQRWFDRFPSVAEGRVTDAVWRLSRDSTGMMVRFKTDATTLWANYTLLSERLAGANMTAIGASGIDLYARDDSGKWRWVGVTRPDQKIVRQQIITGLKPGFREFAAYLPLNN
ncbi:MAG: SGNH/GDSL hydrolase N-terminal domain-containing protein, partial [Opitutaceae bacterium]